MLLKIIANIIIFYCVLNVTHTQSTTPPVITENGAVIGLKTTVNNTTINVFKGIPYGRPPIGDLRFKKTEPAINWNQTYIANNYSPHCMRKLSKFIEVPSLSEDCLYLNVWTPTLNTSANLSVMVWIYGGEITEGSDGVSNIPINYDMSYLVQRNVVVVSFNYRLGIFGFLYGNSSEAPGNAGLWDQVMALNWTHCNIANFGGNPIDITLFGERVGSTFVSNLIVSNNSYGVRDWFNKAILLSGKSKVKQETQRAENAYNLARVFARNAFIDAQCNDDNEWIKCLRDKPALDLLVNGIMDATVYGDYYSLIPYSPNFAAKRGYFRRDLKLLVNYNKVNTIPECETVMFGSYITKWQSFPGRVYQTKFTYRSQNFHFSVIIFPDMNHLDDRIILFGQSFNYGREYNSNDNMILNTIMDMITHFAKTGEALLLNPIVYSDWPPYSVSDGYVNVSYVELNPDPTLLGRVYTDRYSLIADNNTDSYTPNDNSICLDYSVEDSSNTFNSKPSLTHTISTTPPIITENGAFIGLKTTVNGTKFNAFQGIPFARRPNFERRHFKKKLYMNGTHVATIYRPDCLQPGVSVLDEEPEISIDCQYLSVWTPTLNTSENLPVMVWIYSWDFQGFMTPSMAGSLDMNFFPHINYDGRNLVERNVVVVTLYNDALGDGFSGEDLLTDNGWSKGIEAPGNAGVWDQAMALNWTHSNIANFGGNPNDITVFGEKAGSMSINRLIISNYANGESTTQPVITENGAVIGLKTTVNNTTINVFKGIPYAKPPIGDLRFRKTEPAINWSSIYVTTEFGQSCMQPEGIDLGRINEDCLYLNVWTPTLNTSANLSVMVWIYGGPFLVGSYDTFNSQITDFDFSYLAQRNVVVVSFNYRLGVFGFLYGNSSEAPGNAGLWDQVMALNWTHSNIANFGGNPSDITLFGASSGSISISNLIVSNASLGIRNWFNKAVLFSGSAYAELATHFSEYAYNSARDYAKNAFKDQQCNNDSNWIDCLRNKPALDLLDAQIANIHPIGTNVMSGTLQFQPIYGDVFSLLPYSPNSAVKNGYFRQDFRILMNHNEMEGEYFTRFTSILDRKYYFDNPNTEPINKSSATNVLDVLFKYYAFKQQVVNGFVEPFSNLEINPHIIQRSLAYAFGDFIISCPTVLFGAYIRKWQSFTGRVYQTRFTYQSSSRDANIWSNATHLEDIVFLFAQQFIDYGEYGPVCDSKDLLINNKIMDLITHFAKKGEVILLNPTVYNTWPPYSVSKGYVNVSYVELNPDPTRLGRVYTDRYRGNDGYTPKDIYNCFNFWDQYFK